jgi:hypothetical protein
MCVKLDRVLTPAPLFPDYCPSSDRLSLFPFDEFCGGPFSGADDAAVLETNCFHGELPG